MAADFGVQLQPKVLVDASACKGIATRRGVGKVRHLHTQVLWLQDAVGQRLLRIEKIKGTENCADMGTKHLARREMDECMKRAGVRFIGGRSGLALKADVGNSSTSG